MILTSTIKIVQLKELHDFYCFEQYTMVLQLCIDNKSWSKDAQIRSYSKRKLIFPILKNVGRLAVKCLAYSLKSRETNRLCLASF